MKFQEKKKSPLNIEEKIFTPKRRGKNNPQVLKDQKIGKVGRKSITPEHGKRQKKSPQTLREKRINP